MKVEKIYHLADLHIRNLKRHNEYREVFQKFLDNVDRDNKLQLAEISALGFAKDADANDNNIPDVMEQSKLALEQSKFNRFTGKLFSFSKNYCCRFIFSHFDYFFYGSQSFWWLAFITIVRFMFNRNISFRN